MRASDSLSVHSNGVDGFNSSRKGSMAAVMAKEYDTWFTRPNHALTSVRLVGVGKSLMAAVNLSAGQTSVGVTVNPANLPLFLAKRNLAELRVMPFRVQISSHSVA